MAAENSFDIACKIDMQEVTNAIDQARREIDTRYDLKGSKNEIVLEKTDIKVRHYMRWTEMFPWLLAPGLGLLVLEAGLSGSRLRRLP